MDGLLIRAHYTRPWAAASTRPRTLGVPRRQRKPTKPLNMLLIFAMARIALTFLDGHVGCAERSSAERNPSSSHGRFCRALWAAPEAEIGCKFAHRARSRRALLGAPLLAADPGAVAIRPDHGLRSHQGRHRWRDRAPDPGYVAAAVRPRRPVPGRLHRFRDAAPGTGGLAHLPSELPHDPKNGPKVSRLWGWGESQSSTLTLTGRAFRTANR